MPEVVRVHTLIIDDILIRNTTPGVWTQRGPMTLYGVSDLSEYWLRVGFMTSRCFRSMPTSFQSHPMLKNVCESWVKILKLCLEKLHPEVLSAKWRPFCSDLNALRVTCNGIIQPTTCEQWLPYQWQERVFKDCYKLQCSEHSYASWQNITNIYIKHYYLNKKLLSYKWA